MLRRLGSIPCLVVLALLAAVAIPAARAVETAHFDVTLDKNAAEAASSGRPVTGRLYVFLSQHEQGEPRFGPDWFAPEPFFGVDVKEFEPGTSRRIDDTADGFPDRLSRVPAGKYRVQAVLDDDFYHHHHAHGLGNLYSVVSEWYLDPSAPAPLELTLDQVVQEQPLPQTERLKEMVIRSERLSNFHRRDVLVRAAVVLPASYLEQVEGRYGVIYIIPGFGGSHHDARRYADQAPQLDPGEVEFIRVVLNADCKWGHHVFADSATNGPRGESLVRELIPHIDEHFRTIAAPTARFLTGHSSGGWSSLWLQVNYPDVFGGAWSTSPDPVDFRDYQQVDLYADPPLSLYFDEQGHRRPIARQGDQPSLWYDSFGKMDDVLGRGGQLRSFEAVFSPLDQAGLPRKLWDRQTGRIDPQVAKAWRKYDIRLHVERNWSELEPKLRGKLHVVTGELDTFYLEGAVGKLAASLKQLGSDAEITIVPGKNHTNLLTPELYQAMRRQMCAAFLQHHAGR